MLIRCTLIVGLLGLTPSCFSTGKTLGVSVHGLVVDDYTVDGSLKDSVTGYGIEGHLMQFGPDISLGFEKREIGKENADEMFVGGRFFVIDSPIVSPYVSGRVRYSADGLDVGNSDSYTGYAIGAGAYVWFLGPTFIDVNIHYEGLFSDPDVGGTSTGFDGLVGTIGLGISF